MFTVRVAESTGLWGPLAVGGAPRSWSRARDGKARRCACACVEASSAAGYSSERRRGERAIRAPELASLQAGSHIRERGESRRGPPWRLDVVRTSTTYLEVNKC
jgi:hypothetical protein